MIRLYDNSTSQVRFAGGKFSIKVGVHHGSALSTLLFKLLAEEATKSIRKGDPWELLYAEDLVLTAESKVAVEDMFDAWSSAMELGGLKVNIAKTKLLLSEKKNEAPEPYGQYPCAVCNHVVGVNSILCWVCSRCGTGGAQVWAPLMVSISMRTSALSAVRPCRGLFRVMSP